MKAIFSMKVACLSLAMVVVSCAWAQEAAEGSSETTAAASSETATSENTTEGEKPAAAPVPAGKEFRFLPLMRCVMIRGGRAEICPQGGTWQEVVQGRYYPFGSEVRLSDAAADATARFEIGEKAAISVVGNSAFATREIAIGEKTRTVLLKSGTVALDLPRSLKDGLVSVASPDFVCRDLAGESRFECGETADGREVVVRVVTGSLSLEGRHYKIMRMGAANQVRICTSPDALLTSLRGESGDYKVVLDCGITSVLDPETGKEKIVPQTIDYSLSPKCAVKIWRKVSEKSAGGSGRMAVAVQTFDAQGKDKNFRAFFEDRCNVNSGELVVVPKDAAKEESEKNKSAAEDVEEVSAPAESGETSSGSSSTGAGDAGASETATETAAPAAGDGL